MRKNAKQYVELICTATGESFMKAKKDYTKRIKEGCTRFFKNDAVAREYLIREKIEKAKEPIIKICLCCQKTFNARDKAKPKVVLYCSRECATTHYHARKTVEPFLIQKTERAKKERALKPRVQRQPKSLKNHMCIICAKSFTCLPNRPRKTCSDKCHSESQSRSAIKRCLGGETNYRHFKYKGIHMDSQWEVDIATWLDKHDIEWQRGKHLVFEWVDNADKTHRYYPDFYLPAYDVYLDPKNKYLIEKDRFKIETVMKTHGIKVIWGLKDDVLRQLKQLPLILVNEHIGNS